ncbi:cytochrome c oxidase assembly factor 1 homolog isoform 2-T2 [Dugong dugon]
MPVPLGKLFLFTGVVTGGGSTLVYYLTQKMFSKTSYYQLALEHLHSHPEALEALGLPVNIHYLHLTDRFNFIDITDARLKIPVSGSKAKGHLCVSSSRDAPFKRWNLQEIFSELRGGQQIPMFKSSEENSEDAKRVKVIRKSQLCPSLAFRPDQCAPCSGDRRQPSLGANPATGLFPATSGMIG